MTSHVPFFFTNIVNSSAEQIIDKQCSTLNILVRNTKQGSCLIESHVDIENGISSDISQNETDERIEAKQTKPDGTHV